MLGLCTGTQCMCTVQWSRSWYVHYLQSFLQDFYITLRKQHQGMDSTPITTRQLESLIRLTESRARLELREVATKEDAEEVIEIMKYRSVGVQALYLQNTVMLSPINHSCHLNCSLSHEVYKAGACLRFLQC